MAEVQSHPPATRGRGSGRGGRGGFSNRGGRQSSAAKATNGELPTAAAALPMVSLDEQGEMGRLKKTYASQLDTMREMFPDWSDDDLVLALQDSDGDMGRTAEKISEGNVSQFSDVKKKTKEKSKVKKDVPATTEATTTSTRGRGRGGLDNTRGGRGRGSERGGRGRGGRGGATSVARTPATPASVPTTEAFGTATTAATAPSGMDVNGSTANNVDSTVAGSWATSMDDTAATAPEVPKSSLIPEGSKKSWASMLAQSKVAPVAKAAAAPATSGLEEVPYEATIEPGRASAQAGLESEAMAHDLANGGPPQIPAMDETPPTPLTDGSAADLTPPRDRLTEGNLEQIPDSSQPIATDTVASVRDVSSTVGASTPLGQPQASAPSRPPMGGYATSAWKATGSAGRSASFQKRIAEQREAVVMPGNHAVDRASVQFGSMGLDSKPLDVDDEREEAQTRAPVTQSPPSQPRASLPPVLHQSMGQEAPLQDHQLPTPKQAPGFPMPSQPPSTSIAGPPSSQQGSQGNVSYGQYNRYGGGTLGGQESSMPPSKPYDPFSQQLGYSQPQSDSQQPYSTQSQAQNSQQGQSSVGAYNDYNSQYGNDQQRGSSGSYPYGAGYGQQNASQNEAAVGPQRTGSAFTGGDSGYNASQTAGAPGRFTEGPASGNGTPNPAAAQQHGGAQPQHVPQGQGHQQSGQGGHAGSYQYQNPYYGGYNYGSYMNQYPNSYYNQQGYGAPYGNKGNMYGQPHHGYGMSPQNSYAQHSASPANTSSYMSNMRGSADNALSSGLGDYGRSNSTQPSQPSTSAAGAYPSQDNYGRGSSGYGQGGYGQQQMDESLKPFGDAKSGNSPKLSQSGAHSGSATNSGYGGNQSSFPPPSGQQGYGGGYPSHYNQNHNNHGSGYGNNAGGLGGHQSSGQTQQTGGYGGYGGFGGNSYNYGRGGWGGNYGH